MAERKFPKAREVPAHPNQIFSKVRQKLVALTPEEKVRQDFLEVLLSKYGYTVDQIAKRKKSPGVGRAMPAQISSSGGLSRTSRTESRPSSLWSVSPIT